MVSGLCAFWPFRLQAGRHLLPISLVLAGFIPAFKFLIPLEFILESGVRCKPNFTVIRMSAHFPTVVALKYLHILKGHSSLERGGWILSPRLRARLRDSALTERYRSDGHRTRGICPAAPCGWVPPRGPVPCCEDTVSPVGNGGFCPLCPWGTAPAGPQPRPQSWMDPPQEAPEPLSTVTAEFLTHRNRETIHVCGGFKTLTSGVSSHTASSNSHMRHREQTIH